MKGGLFMGLKPVFFASVIARKEQIEASEAQVRHELRGLEAQADIPVAVILTGGTEDKALRWLAGSDRPVTILALPHSNSLPASLEILARLGQQGRRGRIVVLGRGDWRGELVQSIRLTGLSDYLAGARIGLLGGPSAWLAASSPAPELVREVWGPEVVTIPLDEVVRRYQAGIEDGAAGRGAGSATRPEGAGPPDSLPELRAGAGAIVEPDETTLSGAARLYRILADLAREHHLDALTIRCFDLLEPLENTGCYALSRLNDENVVAACEGDLPATLTMMVLARLSGQACFMANPSDIDTEKGTITFGHCSVPLGIVEDYDLRSHFESGLGVGLAGRFGPGEMTVARIGGSLLVDGVAFTGTVVDVASREDLCRTQVTLKVRPLDLDRLLSDPLGNHHILTPGCHATAFLRFVDGVRDRHLGSSSGR